MQEGIGEEGIGEGKNKDRRDEEEGLGRPDEGEGKCENEEGRRD